MAWFKLVNPFLHAVTQWVSERAKCCNQICASALGRSNISRNGEAVSYWGISSDLFQQRSLQVSPVVGRVEAAWVCTSDGHATE